MLRSTRKALLAAVMTTACLNVTGGQVHTFPFDFSVPGSGIGEGWLPGIADVPADLVSDVGLAGDYGALPLPYADFTGIKQGGATVNGNLFLFHKKFIPSPWAPGRTFTAAIDIAFVSDQHSDCTTGPGPLVLIKGGVSSDEPLATPDNQGVLRFNLDKGTGSSAGDFVQLGDIQNGLTGCPATGSWQLANTVQSNQQSILTINELGGFWIWFGTQSTFSGRHDIYFVRFRVTFEEQTAP